jgi:hypothetical protein
VIRERRIREETACRLLALSAITMVSVWIGSLDGQDALRPNAAATTSAIVIALVKVARHLSEFMEVRHAPVLLGRLTDLWLVVTGVSLLGCYFFGLAFARG